MVGNPTSWGQVLECLCPACRELSRIYLRCLRERAYLFVSDCRMFGRGFQVVDVRRVFLGPATEGVDHAELAAAAEYVLARQQHCDAYVSSFPHRREGCADYVWTAERIA